MEMTQDIQQGTYTVTINGNLAFPDHTAFREVLEKIKETSIHQIAFQVAKLDYVDSSGLGMLLLALETAQKRQKPVVLLGASGSVKKMFSLTRMDRMFAAGLVG